MAATTSNESAALTAVETAFLLRLNVATTAVSEYMGAARLFKTPELYERARV
jgi:hypothetical protein